MVDVEQVFTILRYQSFITLLTPHIFTEIHSHKGMREEARVALVILSIKYVMTLTSGSYFDLKSMTVVY